MIEIRKAKADDIAFIQSSWGTSYYNSRLEHRWLNNTVFHQHHRPARERILEHGQVNIACSKEYPDVIIGWIAFERPEDQPCIVLHYVYVKMDFRGQGIGSKLLEVASRHEQVYCSHDTAQGGRLLHARDMETTYIPHLI